MLDVESPERRYLQEAQVYKGFLPFHLAVLPLAQDYLPYVAVPADA